MKDTSLSVLIITRDRVADLRYCVTSLLAQLEPPKEIVVIDNSGDKKTFQFIKKIRETSLIPIKYVHTSVHHFAVLRNVAIKKASYSWTAFIDDDCIASEDWVHQLKKAIIWQDLVAVTGTVQSRFHMFPSLVTEFFNSFWKANRVGENGKILSYEILDTSNTAYNKKILLSSHLSFNSSLEYSGKGEDCVFGIQVQDKHIGKALFLPQVKVLHRFPDTWRCYYSKLFLEIEAYFFNVEKKRKKHNFSKQKKSHQNFLKYFLHFTQKYHIEHINLVIFSIHVFITILITKFMRYYYRLMFV